MKDGNDDKVDNHEDQRMIGGKPSGNSDLTFLQIITNLDFQGKI